MPGVDLDKLYADPRFQKLDDDGKKSVLTKLGYDGSGGGGEAKLSQGTPQSDWDQAREAISRSIFGDPDREEARAAGIGLQPTPADLAGAVGKLGLDTAAIAGPALLGANAPAIGGAAASAGGAALRAAGASGASYVLPMAGQAIGTAVAGPWGGAAGSALGTALASRFGGGGASKAASRAADATRAAKAAKAAGSAEDIIEAEIVRASAPRALPAASVAAQEAGAIEDYVTMMRQKAPGLSGAQIQDMTRRQFGLKMSEARNMVNMILESMGK